MANPQEEEDDESDEDAVIAVCSLYEHSCYCSEPPFFCLQGKIKTKKRKRKLTDEKRKRRNEKRANARKLKKLTTRSTPTQPPRPKTGQPGTTPSQDDPQTPNPKLPRLFNLTSLSNATAAFVTIDAVTLLLLSDSLGELDGVKALATNLATDAGALVRNLDDTSTDNLLDYTGRFLPDYPYLVMALFSYFFGFGRPARNEGEEGGLPWVISYRNRPWTKNFGECSAPVFATFYGLMELLFFYLSIPP